MRQPSNSWMWRSYPPPKKKKKNNNKKPTFIYHSNRNNKFRIQNTPHYITLENGVLLGIQSQLNRKWTLSFLTVKLFRWLAFSFRSEARYWRMSFCHFRFKDKGRAFSFHGLHKATAVQEVLCLMTFKWTGFARLKKKKKKGEKNPNPRWWQRN